MHEQVSPPHQQGFTYQLNWNVTAQNISKLAWSQDTQQEEVNCIYLNHKNLKLLKFLSFETFYAKHRALKLKSWKKK
jgi:hypothetical protein